MITRQCKFAGLHEFPLFPYVTSDKWEIQADVDEDVSCL